MSVIVALVVSHTGLVSLPVPVVGQQNSTLLHVPVVPLVLVSRARVVVGTGFPLLFHFSYHYYSPGCSHPGSSMRDIATLTITIHPAAPILGAACGTLRRSQRHKTRGGLMAKS